MRLPAVKILACLLLAATFCFLGYEIFSVNRSARQTLADERARQNSKYAIPFEKKFLTPHQSQKIRFFQNTESVRDFVRFRESYFAATGGGLVEYPIDGKTIKHYTVLDGLPESDVTALAVYENKIFIGTRTKNLVAFDGERFENYIWTNQAAQAIAAFLETDGKLLIGTQNGGLLEFDGEKFTEIKASGKTLKHITCLFKDKERLFVGTFDNGAWIYKNDVWSQFTASVGNLPSNRIVGFAVKGEQTYVATDLGLAVWEDDEFHLAAGIPSLSSLAFVQNILYLTKDDGEVGTFKEIFEPISAAPPGMQNARLLSLDGRLLLLSNQGIAEISGAQRAAFPEASSAAKKAALTDNFISAITIDRYENLWIGTFRRGIDVLNRNGEKVNHFETEDLREINFLGNSGGSRENFSGTISGATSAGIFDFKGDDSPVPALGRKDNLPSVSITHFAGDYIATAKGLVYRERATPAGNRLRLISAAQGLPNNSIYSLLVSGKKLYAGTLGGLAEVENGRVTRVYKDTNSNLSTNWVTALCETRERIFIGTYGGGIYELLPSGEIRSFAAETGKFAVNPNAFYSDGERLYAGTLEGVRVLNLESGEWTTLKDALPAEGVFSIAGVEREIYFGTTAGIARIEKSFFQKNETQ